MSGHADALDLAGQLELQVLVAAGLVGPGLHPLDLLELDADVVHQIAARIDARGVRKVRVADALAAQLFERIDAAALLHIERRVAEHARREHRDRHQAVVTLREHAGPFSERHFADVPLLVAGRSVENFRRRQDLEIDVESFGCHPAINEIAHMIVIADRQRDRKLAHVSYFLLRILVVSRVRHCLSGRHDRGWVESADSRHWLRPRLDLDQRRL